MVKPERAHVDIAAEGICRRLNATVEGCLCERYAVTGACFSHLMRPEAEAAVAALIAAGCMASCYGIITPAEVRARMRPAAS